MSWSDLFTDRLTGIVEGTYPATPETGRTIAADRFRPTLMHGQLEDPSFPAAHYNQGYRLALGQAVPLDGFNARSGIAKVRQRFVVSVGYLFGRSAPRRAAGVGTATRSAEDVGADDLWALANALCYSAHWGTLNASPALGLYGIAWLSSDVRTLQDRSRFLRETTFDALVSLVPGAVYP